LFAISLTIIFPVAINFVWPDTNDEIVILLFSNLLIVTLESTSLLSSKSSTEPLVTPTVFPFKSSIDETLILHHQILLRKMVHKH